MIKHCETLLQAAASDDELPDEIHKPFQAVPTQANGRLACARRHRNTNAFASLEAPGNSRRGCRRRGRSFDDGGSGDPCRPPLSQCDERALEFRTARIEL